MEENKKINVGVVLLTTLEKWRAGQGVIFSMVLSLHFSEHQFPSQTK